MVAVAAEASGAALYGGDQGRMWRMSPDGSSLSALPRQIGRIFSMAADPQGNVFIAGQTTQGNSVSGTCLESYNVRLGGTYLPAGDIFVTKLVRDTLQQSYSARLNGNCQTWPITLLVAPSGEATLSLWTFSAFPLLNPVLMGSSGRSALARLNADGSMLLLSSYLVGGSAIALAPDGSTYVSAGAAILQLPAPPVSGAPSVTGAFNAFSGAAAGFVPVGGLLTITGQNLAPGFADLGLAYSDPLPRELGGVKVLFGDTPAEMFQVAPDHVICFVPATTPGSNVLVRVISGSQTSVPFIFMPSYSASFPGFLTVAFPNLPPTTRVDGNIRNADGSLNDVQHPAPTGSAVTLFATGLTAPGPIDLLWNPPAPQFPPAVIGRPRACRCSTLFRAACQDSSTLCTRSMYRFRIRPLRAATQSD